MIPAGLLYHINRIYLSIMTYYIIYIYILCNHSDGQTTGYVLRGDIPSITKHHSFNLLPVGVNIVVAIALCVLYHSIAYILLRTMPPVTERR